MKSLGNLNQETRTVLSKVGKAIAQLNTQQALAQATIQKQAAQLQELTTTKRQKQVTHDPNTHFANIDSIMQAQREAKAFAAKQAARQLDKEAQRLAEEMQKTSMESCMNSWQIEM